MKRKIYRRNNIVLLACIAFLAISCSDIDTQEGYNAELAVQFTPQLKGHQAATRAVDTSWSASDKVGICRVSDGGSLPADAEFMQYKVSGAGESVGLLPTAADQTLYYPANGDNVNFIAFSPYVEPGNNKVTYSSFDNQSTQANMEAVDVLYSNNKEAFNRTSSSAALTFNHVMSKLVIKVTTTGAASEQIDLSSLTIGVSGLPASAGFDLSDGIIEPSSGKTAVQPFHTDGTDERIATTIVVPHAGADFSGRGISFTLGNADGGGAFSFTLPSTYNFASGKMYVMEFVATMQGVTHVDTQSYDWADGYVVWDNDYVLSVGETTKYVAPSNSGNTIEFKTNNSAHPTVTYSTSATDAGAGIPSWVSPGLFLTSSNKTGYVLYNASFDITGTPDADRFYAHITVGELKAVVEVRVVEFTKSANCVMLPIDGVTMLIPVSRANEYTAFVGAATLAIGIADAFTTEVLWSDTDGLLTEVKSVGTGASGFVLVTAAEGKAGNAVVAAKVNDVIVWSWHIWVVDYDPDNGGGTFTNISNSYNAKFMDRNLGATAAGYGTDETNSTGTHGLYYQWGRKDPFPSTLAPGAIQPGGGSFIAMDTNSTLGTVVNTIKNPTVFLSGVDGSDYDWYYGGGTGVENRNNTLWGNLGDKTIYDPCPVGWRVPTDANGTAADCPWVGFSDGSNKPTSTVGSWSSGWSWGPNATYPATGNRNYSTGTVSNAGSYGYYWSSLVSSTMLAFNLGFNLTTVNTRNSSNRSHGFSVRCVADPSI